MSAAFRNETGNPGRHHRVEPASGLNSTDLVNSSFWNLRDVVILARSLQSFRGGKDGRSTLDPPGEQHLGRGQRGLLGDGQLLSLGGMVTGAPSKEVESEPITKWNNH